jgi:hypothetical protein
VSEKAPNESRLIALEGTHGPDLAAATESLLRKLADRKRAWGASRWDASNTFFEMRFAKSSVPPASVRMLILLYASDLVFRLRWEIAPALKEGKLVVAAPYVDTAVALGVAVGLPKRWLADLFSFAPKPDGVFRIEEKKKNWHKKCKPGDGFVEFCCSVLANSHPYPDPADIRARALDYLDNLQEKKGCSELKKKAVAAICES